MRSHINCRGKRNILYIGVEISPYDTRFKTLSGSPKMTISMSSGLKLLQKKTQTNDYLKRNETHPKKGEIPHQLKRRTKHSL